MNLIALCRGDLPAIVRTGPSMCLPWTVAAWMIACTPHPAQEASTAGDFLWRTWDTDHGLPSPRINAMGFDSDGFLWLGTPAGLVRFDGVDFSVFHPSNTPALGDARILSLHTDRNGGLWAGTADGRLLLWRQGQWVRVQLQGDRATQGRSVLSIAEDTHGDLWLATDGAGLLRVPPEGTVEVFDTRHGLPSPVISQVVFDDTGQCWVVAQGRLGRWLGDRWEPLMPPTEPPQPVRFITPALQGGLWVATLSPHPWGMRGTCLFLWKNGAWSEPLAPYPWAQDSTRTRAQAILQDRHGRLWCATAAGGVFVHLPGTGWTEASAGLPPAQLQVQSLIEDPHGTIWIGTRTLGLLQLRPRPVAASPLPVHLRPHVFLSACLDRQGRLWGGTDGAGLFVWDGGTWQQVALNGPSDNLYVCVLLADRNGAVWAGTFSGLYRLPPKPAQPGAEHPALRQTTTALYEDRAGRIWAGTQGGLVCLEGPEIRVYGPEAGLPLAPARAISEDSQGNIWVAVPAEGLFRQQGDGFEPVNPQRHPALRTIRALWFDPEDRLWFATLGYGLGCLENERIRIWSSAEGLPSDHLLAMVPWQDHLWVSSENGLFGLKPREWIATADAPGQRVRLIRLTPREGLPFKVCTGLGQPAAGIGPDGSLVFPNGAAIVRFRPEQSLTQPEVRPPRVLALRIEGLLQNPVPDQPIRIRSGPLSYEFHYSSPNLWAPEHVRYRYQLIGLDRHAIEAGPRKVAFYNRIPPGRYQFKVWAAAFEDQWVEAAVPLQLEILPRWWERSSLQVAGAFTLTAVLTLAVWRWERLRSRRRMEQLRWQRAMDLERQRIARDIHDDLGSGLTEIILLSDTLREESAHLPQVRRWADEIAACARRLTRAMDEVVWANNPRHDTLESLLTYLNRFAQEHLNRAGIRCRWDVPLEVPPLPLSAETRHHLYLACKEALHNVVKHAAASEVWIRFRQHDAGLEFVIEDDGRGFDLAETIRAGNGLRHMQQRLEDIGGACRIQSQPGQGTRVILTVSHCAAARASHPPP